MLLQGIFFSKTCCDSLYYEATFKYEANANTYRDTPGVNTVSTCAWLFFSNSRCFVCRFWIFSIHLRLTMLCVFCSLQCMMIMWNFHPPQMNGKHSQGSSLNTEFLCLGAWDGFHVYVSWKIKFYVSSKSRYAMWSLRFVGYNISFLYAAVGAPVSTHDARILKSTCLCQSILNGENFPEKAMTLEGSGNIPLATIGDKVFTRHPWLWKGYNENTSDYQKSYFNKKLCNERLARENAFGMLKDCLRILHKKPEWCLHNLKYVIMSCIMFHYLCIKHNDPCELRWSLEVKELWVLWLKEQLVQKTRMNLTWYALKSQIGCWTYRNVTQISTFIGFILHKFSQVLWIMKKRRCC